MRIVPFLAALSLLGSAHARVTVPPFQHVVVIVFENKDTAQVLGNRAAPTFNTIARRYATLTRYYGVAHPSLPNYLALVSGSTHGIRTDCTDCVVSGPSLADTLERAGRTWKLYAEGLPSPGFTGPFAGAYAKKHNPFVYFHDVLSSPARLARVVALPQLRADLRARAVPDLAVVVPNLCHSMHDCSVSVGDRWLRSTLPPLLGLPDTVVFVLFDEGTSSVRGGGHVPAIAAGTAVRRGARFSGLTSHYGVLRTIETAWQLPLLGRSASAKPITGVWR